MRSFLLLICCFSITTLLSSCDLFGRVADKTKETVGTMQKGVETTVKTTTDTINTAKEKVENVGTAVGNLQKSVTDLETWQNQNNNTITNQNAK